MTELLNLRYQYDPTGQAQSNLIIDELQNVAQNGARLAVVTEGVFYTTDFSIRKVGTSTPLVLNTDYHFVSMDSFITAETGIETATGVALDNPDLFGDFYITYRCVGGVEGRSNALVADLIEAIELARNSTVDWKKIINVPAMFPPDVHDHQVTDLTGLEAVTQAINGLERAILDSRPLHLSAANLHQQDERILQIISTYNDRLNSIYGFILEVEDSIDGKITFSEESLREYVNMRIDQEAVSIYPGEEVYDPGSVTSTSERIPGAVWVMEPIDLNPAEGTSGGGTVGGDVYTVDTPFIIAPVDGSVRVNSTPILQSTAYSGSGTHASSRWQIASDLGFSNIVYDSGVTTEGLTLKITDVSLSSNETYYARVMHNSSLEVSSAWSLPAGFMTDIAIPNTQVARLLEVDFVGSHTWNGNMAVSADGTTIIKKGGIGYTATDGVVFVYRKVGGFWTRVQTLTPTYALPSGGAAVNGMCLSADGSTIVIGGNRHVSGHSTVSVFTETSGVWAETQVFASSNPQVTDLFGYSVAIDDAGLVLVVGSYGFDNGADVNRGTAYIFKNVGGTWTQAQKLANGSADNAEAGWFVAISADGNTVGMSDYRDATRSGAVYLYHRSSTTWSYIQKLVTTVRETQSNFGYSFAFSGDGSTLVVGAYTSGGGGTPVGASFVFTKSGTNWVQHSELQRGDVSGWHGYTVDVNYDGSIIAVGAPTAQNPSGRVGIYTRTSNQYDLTDVLEGEGLHSSYGFGREVSLSNDGGVLATIDSGVTAYGGGHLYVFE
jgi:hypothetical protein